MRIEISFDDGLIGDLKAAKLLQKHGFVGTFYIPSTKVKNGTCMSLKEVKTGIQDLGHTIGGHTVSHPMDMKLLDDKDLWFQVENNKAMLEHLIIKGPCEKFCYPRGRHDQRVRDAVKNAGYHEARTTKVLEIRNEFGDPYQTPTTIHMFAREEYEGMHWLYLAKIWFVRALEASRNDDTVFFSLWGHTNEIERQGDWDNFEAFLLFMRHELSTQ